MKNISELSQKQKDVLLYIEEYTNEHGHPPTLVEIQKFFHFKSHSTAQFHVNELTKKGYIQKKSGSRKINLPASDEVLELPILGIVAAGNAIDAIEDNDPEIKKIPRYMLKNPNQRHYLLKVRGDSMKDKHIVEGDLVIIREQNTVNDGEIAVIADEDWQVTLKEVIQEEKYLTLKPANRLYQTYKIELGKCKILGVMDGLIREHT